MKLRTIIISIAAALTLGACSTLSQVSSLLTCDYKFGGVSNPAIAGIGLAGVTDLSNLNAASAVKLATALVSKSLPLTTTVNVNVTNPNSVAAQLAGLEYALFMDQTSIVMGRTEQKVYIEPNGGSATIPLTVQMDVMDLVQKNSKDDIFRFVNSVLNMGDESSNVSLRVKPSIAIGSQTVSPGFITVKKSI